MKTFGAKVLAFSVSCFLVALLMPFIYIWLKNHLPEDYTTPMNGASGASALDIPCGILSVVFGLVGVFGMIGCLVEDGWWKEDKHD